MKFLRGFLTLFATTIGAALGSPLGPPGMAVGGFLSGSLCLWSTKYLLNKPHQESADKFAEGLKKSLPKMRS